MPAWHVRTLTGGMHLYFRHPGGGVRIACSADVIGLGIDVRADGGYVVVPPSRTAEGAYEVIHRAPVNALPQWMLDLLLTPPKKPAKLAAMPLFADAGCAGLPHAPMLEHLRTAARQA